MSYDWEYGSLFLNGKKVASIAQNQFCCGLYDMGWFNENYFNVVNVERAGAQNALEAYLRQGGRRIQAVVPVSNYLWSGQFIEALTAMGFVPFGEQWYNFNTGRDLQCFIKDLEKI